MVGRGAFQDQSQFQAGGWGSAAARGLPGAVAVCVDRWLSAGCGSGLVWADKAKRASFSSGDGATTFRLPDNNGKQKDSFGAAVKRGDGALSAGAPGLIQDSQNKEHDHAAAVTQAGAHSHTVSGSTGQAGSHNHGYTGNEGQGNPDGATDTYGAIGTNRSYVRYSKLQDAGAHAHDVSGTAAAAGSHTHEVSVTKQGGTEARGIATTGCHVMRVK